jgi:hypothetical protein
MSASRWARPLAVAVLVFAWTARPGRLAAQDEESETAVDRSERLFRQGRVAVEAGDCLAAIPLFEESQRIEPAVGTLLNLALCEERLGHLALARATLADALSIAAPGDHRRSLISERLAKLDAQLLLQDHVPTVGAPKADRSLVPPPAVAVASPALVIATPPPPSRRRTASKVFLGVGVAGIAAGLAAGAAVLHEKSVVQARCDRSGLCDADGVTAARWGTRWSLASTSATALGLASLGLSLYFRFSGPGV